jgi:hypothetical protein
VTFVIGIHVLLVALAGLLLLERWLDDNRCHVDDDATGPIDFHPELIVPWDDESEYSRPATCARRSIAMRPVRRDAQSAPARRSHTR